MLGKNRALVALISTVVSFSGCSEGNTPSSIPQSPWQGEFEAAVAMAESDFERHVLMDGHVTDAEYAEAIQNYVACMSESGISESVDLTTGQRSGVVPDGMEESELDEIQMSCHRQKVGEIESLYWAVRQNPNNEDWEQLFLDCLIRTGFADASETMAEIDARNETSGGSLDSRYNSCIDNPTTAN